ncbi:unnamed protein product [Moneuplotes crassus]|uniref:Uncharacterized protein n=1 Tax=Euplotes crassus TaxID=5936 RepID=A0AAD2D6S8_EUPCR|nr:unnamed protein product [Moneuplotes crassus]
MINSLKSQTRFARTDDDGYFFTRDTEALLPGNVFEGAASNCITPEVFAKDFSLFDSEEEQACFPAVKGPEPPISTRASVGGEDLYDYQVRKLEGDLNFLCISEASKDSQRNEFKSAKNSGDNKEDISCNQANAQSASGSSSSSRRRTKASSSGRSDIEFKAALRLLKRFFKISSSQRIIKLLEKGILTEICKKSNPRCKHYFVSSSPKKNSQKSLCTTPLVLLTPSGDQDLIEVKKLKMKFPSSIHVVRHFQGRNLALFSNLEISEFCVVICPRNGMIPALE